MKSNLVLTFLSVILSFHFLIAQDSLSIEGVHQINPNFENRYPTQTTGVKRLTITHENDFFLRPFGELGGDSDFTTSLSTELVVNDFTSKLFIFPKFGNKSKNGPGDPFVRNFSTLATGLFYYTPDSLNTPDIIPDDRPYASFQYISIGHLSEILKRKSDLTNNSYSRLESTLYIGYVGGKAAQNLQDFIHVNLTGADRPEGWDNQIGRNKHLIAYKYDLIYSVLALSSPLNPREKKSYNPNGNIYNINQLYNIIARFQLESGSLINSVSVGARLNFLNKNYHNEHFLDLLDYNQAIDFPAGPAPLLNPKKSKSPFEAMVKVRNQGNLIDFQFDGMAEYKEMILGLFGSTSIDPDSLQTSILRNKIKEKIKSLQETLTNDAIPENEKAVIGNELLKFSDLFEFIKKRDETTLKFLFKDQKYGNNQWRFRFFLDAELKAVAHNGLLQGILFYENNTDNFPHTIDLLSPFVLKGEFGVNCRPFTDWIDFRACSGI